MQIVTHTTALAAKQVGFSQDNRGTRRYQYYNCHGQLNGCCLEDLKRIKAGEPTQICYAPTQSELQKWLREEYGYHFYVDYNNDYKKWIYIISEFVGDVLVILDFPIHEGKPSPEEATEAALQHIDRKSVV